MGQIKPNSKNRSIALHFAWIMSLSFQFHLIPQLLSGKQNNDW